MDSIPVADFDEILAQNNYDNSNNAISSGFSLKQSLSEELNNSSWGIGLSNSFITDAGDANFIIKKQQEVFKKYESKFLHILKKIKLFNLFVNIITPIFSLFYLIFKGKTILNFSKEFQYLIIINYFIHLVAIFIGYHKYFTHRSFQFNKVFELVNGSILAFLGLGVGLGSILEFKTYHLLHHHHIDTVKDPLNYELGWLFHQWGHLLFKGKKKAESEYLRNINKQKTQSFMNDVTSKIIKWQHETRYQLLFVNWVLFPLIISKVMMVSKWDCIFWLTFFKLSLTQQQWLLSETFGHKYPIFLAKNKKKLDYLKMPSVNSSLNLPLLLNYLIGLLTLGETNHSFHHAFPNDYRQSNHWYYLDLQKCVILILYYLGIVNKVYKVNDAHILKFNLENEQRLLDYELNLNLKVNKNVSVNDLPIWTVDEFAYKSAKLWKEQKIALVLVEGIIHDVTSFISGHPGGEQLIISAIGKDATEAFNGGVYYHSNASRNLMSNMRIGVLITENNGVWGKKHNNNKSDKFKEDEDDHEYRLRLEIIKLQNSKKFFAPLSA
ncbi:uncharacterized protein HGUI_01948 [Hanseniaspora guilliermondii]|uniref:Cytochrome b5 heme-binding domain-containing protein n=1 Tax=Hanseniaspora guilliermondii TaxID=56406 RepID=A0A1L0B1R6_9ASCO|nr:uncharacterized protein HGUI_01948 [Hanseniaspora guilliermondii]